MKRAGMRNMCFFNLALWLHFFFIPNSSMIIFQVTECEIFLSLLVKFLEPDKPQWQRALALEVLHTLTIQPALLRYCFHYYFYYYFFHTPRVLCSHLLK